VCNISCQVRRLDTSGLHLKKLKKSNFAVVEIHAILSISTSRRLLKKEKLELIFPFKNIALNNLIPFFEKGKVKQFVKIRRDKDKFEEKCFKHDIEFFKDRLPNFENEILQIIGTTNQETIDYFFYWVMEKLFVLKWVT